MHLISLSSTSAVSLFPARATLAPLDQFQSDPSVKSDPFSLSRTGSFVCQSPVDGAKCPPSTLQVTTAARKGLLISPAKLYILLTLTKKGATVERCKHFPLTKSAIFPRSETGDRIGMCDNHGSMWPPSKICHI